MRCFMTTLEFARDLADALGYEGPDVFPEVRRIVDDIKRAKLAQLAKRNRKAERNFKVLREVLGA
jgi:hypothetical protein